MLTPRELTRLLNAPPAIAMLATAGIIGSVGRVAGLVTASIWWAHTRLDLALVALAGLTQTLAIIATVGLVTYAITAGHRRHPVGVLLLCAWLTASLPGGFVNLVVRDAAYGLGLPIFEIVAGFLGAVIAADIFIRWVRDRPRSTTPAEPACPAGERAGEQPPWGQ